MIFKEVKENLINDIMTYCNISTKKEAERLLIITLNSNIINNEIIEQINYLKGVENES